MTFIILDDVLGEYDLAVKVGVIEFSGNPDELDIQVAAAIAFAPSWKALLTAVTRIACWVIEHRLRPAILVRHNESHAD